MARRGRMPKRMREARRLRRQRRRVVRSLLSAGRERDAPALAPPEEIGTGRLGGASHGLRVSAERLSGLVLRAPDDPGGQRGSDQR